MRFIEPLIDAQSEKIEKGGKEKKLFDVILINMCCRQSIDRAEALTEINQRHSILPEERFEGNGLGSLLWDETDSCSRGCEFESQHQIRGGYFHIHLM